MEVKSAIKSICKAICNTCYVDDDVIETLVLTNRDIDPLAEAVDITPAMVEVALTIVRGWVETSRSEGGISVSTSTDSIDSSIMFWCNKYDLDADDFLINGKVIENGSNLW